MAGEVIVSLLLSNPPESLAPQSAKQNKAECDSNNAATNTG